MARSLIVECFDRSIDEFKDSVLSDLESMVELSDEEWDAITLNVLGCDESPFGGSMYQGAPRSGSQCLFCGGHYR